MCKNNQMILKMTKIPLNLQNNQNMLKTSNMIQVIPKPTKLIKK